MSKPPTAINNPELATAAITGPESSGEQLVYSFVRAIGTKG